MQTTPGEIILGKSMPHKHWGAFWLAAAVPNKGILTSLNNIDYIPQKTTKHLHFAIVLYHHCTHIFTAYLQKQLGPVVYNTGCIEMKYQLKPLAHLAKWDVSTERESLLRWNFLQSNVELPKIRMWFRYATDNGTYVCR